MSHRSYRVLELNIEFFYKTSLVCARFYEFIRVNYFIPSGGLEIVPHRVCRNLWGWESREAAEARGTVLKAAGERAGRPARALGSPLLPHHAVAVSLSSTVSE